LALQDERGFNAGDLRRHCEAEKRDYQAIERTSIIRLLLGVMKLRSRRNVECSPFLAHSTASQAPCHKITDLIGRYQEAGVQMLISSAYKNDLATHELLADVMPRFM
jgi:hypothetical protein